MCLNTGYKTLYYHYRIQAKYFHCLSYFWVLCLNRTHENIYSVSVCIGSKTSSSKIFLEENLRPSNFRSVKQLQRSNRVNILKDFVNLSGI